MVKITIETDHGFPDCGSAVYTLSEPEAMTMEEVFELMRQGALAMGYHPETVKEFFGG